MIFALTFMKCFLCGRRGAKPPTCIISCNTVIIIHISQMRKLRHKEFIMCPDQVIGQISKSEPAYCLLCLPETRTRTPRLTLQPLHFEVVSTLVVGVQLSLSPLDRGQYSL